MIVLFVILFPVLAGLILPLLKLNKLSKNIYVLVASTATSLISLYLTFVTKFTEFNLLNINEVFSIGFKNDGLSQIFLLMISILWPIATLYATEYMEHEENQNSFFRYYLIAFGVAIGLTFSANLITFYLFYELLTFITMPLIMHKSDEKKSLYAGKVYLIVSIFGASLALMGVIILTTLNQSIGFVYGGNIDATNLSAINLNTINIAYLLCFLGFGVKAAILPFTYWLPTCGVAPTPVSALLHAVAVVKAGVLAIMRVTYYVFGTAVLTGGYANKIAMAISIVTIFYSSIMAVKDRQIKRRLAYSTASNLSYILFAVTLLTADGFAASLSHMLFHAIIKINLFFVAGSIMIYANKEYVNNMKGIAKKMSVSMFAFLISSLGMIGVPLTCGFISKFKILEAAVETNGLLEFLGITAIIVSSILTLVYLFSVVVYAYIPGADFDMKKVDKVKEAGISMKIIFVILTLLIIYFGMNSTSLISFIDNVANGVI